MDQLSLWEATANEQKNRPMLQGDKYCDVVIIGGGLTGLATAYHLQQKDCNTIILEKGKVGSGASGKNGGAVLARFPNSMESWSKSRGIENAREIMKLAMDSVDLVENIVKRHNISCDFTRKGDFHPAFKPTHLEGMKKEQEFMERELGYQETKIVEKSDIQSEMNTSFYHGGLVNKKSAHFHPLNYTLGLADAVEELGGEIYEYSEAIRKHKDSNNKVVISTTNGRVIADEVVIVTNGYSGNFNQVIKKSIVPIESIMIATESLTEKTMKDLIRKNRVVSDSKRLLYYFRRTADNRLAFGGSGRASSKREQRKLFGDLHEGMINVFPQLQNAQIEYQWGGKVGYTWDSQPYIGQLDDGAYFAVGFCGRGVAMSQMMGRTIAENITKENEMNSPFLTEKLRPIPFHSQYAKAVGLVKFYKKFQDRFF